MTNPPISDEEKSTDQGENDAPLVKWWVVKDGQPDGPHGAAYIALLLSDGRIKPTTLVCRVGAQKWQTIISCEELARVAKTQAPGSLPPTIPVEPGMLVKAGKFFGGFTNPALPWFANWICIYCVLVGPALTAVDFLFTIAGVNSASELKPDSPLIWYAVTYDVISFVVGVSLTFVLVSGGLLLRNLQRKGATLVKFGLGLRLCWGVISVVVLILWSALVALGEQAVPASDDFSTGQALMTLLLLPFVLAGLTSLVFEVVALVWLVRNDYSLPLTQQTPTRLAEVIEP
jgi:hypothetical protein